MSPSELRSIGLIEPSGTCEGGGDERRYQMAAGTHQSVNPVGVSASRLCGGSRMQTLPDVPAAAVNSV